MNSLELTLQLPPKPVASLGDAAIASADMSNAGIVAPYMYGPAPTR